jgi:hypothetical protein
LIKPFRVIANFFKQSFRMLVCQLTSYKKEGLFIHFLNYLIYLYCHVCLVRLVCLVCLVCPVCLICLVCLVRLVCLVCPIRLFCLALILKILNNTIVQLVGLFCLISQKLYLLACCLVAPPYQYLVRAIKSENKNKLCVCVGGGGLSGYWMVLGRMILGEKMMSFYLGFLLACVKQVRLCIECLKFVLQSKILKHFVGIINCCINLNYPSLLSLLFVKIPCPNLKYTQFLPQFFFHLDTPVLIFYLSAATMLSLTIYLF